MHGQTQIKFSNNCFTFTFGAAPVGLSGRK